MWHQGRFMLGIRKFTLQKGDGALEWAAQGGDGNDLRDRYQP